MRLTARGIVCEYPGKRSVSIAELFEDGIRELASGLAVCVDAPDDSELPGLLYRKEAKQKRIEHAEDRGELAPMPSPESHDGGDGESGRLTQSAQPVADVTNERLHGNPPMP